MGYIAWLGGMVHWRWRRIYRGRMVNRCGMVNGSRMENWSMVNRSMMNWRMEDRSMVNRSMVSFPFILDFSHITSIVVSVVVDMLSSTIG